MYGTLGYKCWSRCQTGGTERGSDAGWGLRNPAPSWLAGGMTDGRKGNKA